MNMAGKCGVNNKQYIIKFFIIVFTLLLTQPATSNLDFRVIKTHRVFSVTRFDHNGA